MRRRVLAACAVAIAMAAGSACDEAKPLPMPSAIVRTPLAGTLEVEAFSVIEYQYPGEAGWHYAPRMRVGSPAGGAGVIVTRIEFAMPGLGRSPALCAAEHVASGQSRNLFSESYGDYDVSLDSPGKRATPGDATATVTYKDSLGTEASQVVHGAVVPGGLPTANAGGAGTGWSACR